MPRLRRLDELCEAFGLVDRVMRDRWTCRSLVPALQQIKQELRAEIRALTAK